MGGAAACSPSSRWPSGTCSGWRPRPRRVRWAAGRPALVGLRASRPCMCRELLGWRGGGREACVSSAVTSALLTLPHRLQATGRPRRRRCGRSSRRLQVRFRGRPAAVLTPCAHSLQLDQPGPLPPRQPASPPSPPRARAGKLMGQLHDRNCHRAFAPPEAFQASQLPAERFQAEMQASERRSWGAGACACVPLHTVCVCMHAPAAAPCVCQSPPAELPLVPNKHAAPPVASTAGGRRVGAGAGRGGRRGAGVGLAGARALPGALPGASQAVSGGGGAGGGLGRLEPGGMLAPGACLPARLPTKRLLTLPLLPLLPLVPSGALAAPRHGRGRRAGPGAWRQPLLPHPPHPRAAGRVRPAQRPGRAADGQVGSKGRVGGGEAGSEAVGRARSLSVCWKSQLLRAPAGRWLLTARRRAPTAPARRPSRCRVRIQFIDAYGLEEAGVDGGGIFKEFVEAAVREGESACCIILSMLLRGGVLRGAWEGQSSSVWKPLCAKVRADTTTAACACLAACDVWRPPNHLSLPSPPSSCRL